MMSADAVAWIAVIAAFGSHLVVPTINFFRGRSKDDREDDERRTATLVSRLDEQVRRLESENRDLRSRVAHLESLQDELPFPEWTKDRQFRYQWVNQAYEMEFLVPIGRSGVEIIGKVDEDFLSEEVTAALKAVDERALRSSTRRAFCQGFQFAPNAGSYTLCKFPLFKGAIHVGWRGLAIPEDATLPDPNNLKGTRRVIQALDSQSGGKP